MRQVSTASVRRDSLEKIAISKKMNAPQTLAHKERLVWIRWELFWMLWTTLITGNTTPTKPREGRFGYMRFVCDLIVISMLVFQIRAKTQTHCAHRTDELENGRVVCFLFNDVREDNFPLRL